HIVDGQDARFAWGHVIPRELAIDQGTQAAQCGLELKGLD
ncbi:MAG: hypothetical protein H6R16_2448, partial [Proteobacteria bacterium]|nr:hypothetical protein [Pseudomonadota bacterium]